MRASSPNSKKRAAGSRSMAMSAPCSTIAGARSPPIASTAIVMLPFTGRAPCRAACLDAGPLGRRRIGLRHDFAPVVMAAGRAEVMRPLQLAAIRAFGVGGGAERVMRTPHVAARGRGLLFRNSHDRLVASCAPHIVPPREADGTERAGG